MVAGLAAIIVRLPFLLKGNAFFTSDEGVEGLMARHLGELPVFFWAQGHKGVPEVYLDGAGSRPSASVEREARQPSAAERGDLGLVHVQERGRLRLSQTAALDERRDLVCEFRFGQRFFRTGTFKSANTFPPPTT